MRTIISITTLGMLLALAGCSSDMEPGVPGEATAPAADTQTSQATNISYKVGSRGSVTFSAAEDNDPHFDKWQWVGLVTNEIHTRGSEHMECAPAIRNEINVGGRKSEFSTYPSNYVGMKETTIVRGLGHNDWAHATVDRRWVDTDFDAAFAYTQSVIDYALAHMDEKGVYSTEINGKTYVYKRLDTDLNNGLPVGTRPGKHNREFVEEDRSIGNRVTYIVTKDIVIDKSHVSGNVYAPNAKITMRSGASIIGQVVCDKLVIDSKNPCEIKIPARCVRGISPVPTPGTPDPDPEPQPGTEPGTEETTLTIPLDIRREYLVQPDDFAIHNGDKLYVNIANGDTDPTMQTALAKPYLVIAANENPTLTLYNIDEMYQEFIGKTELCNEQKSPFFGQHVPYIAEDGTFTLEAYIWPGTKGLDAAGNQTITPIDYSELGFESLQQAIDGAYIMGTAQSGEVVSKPDDDYTVTMSAFKAIQGKDDTTPYVHVSIHIRPSDK